MHRLFVPNQRIVLPHFRTEMLQGILQKVNANNLWTL